MPPKRRISAPLDRVYKSITPMRQAKLPVQKKRIKYGKQAGPRVPKVDNTLTQMDFVQMNLPISDDEEDRQEAEEEEEAVEKASEKQGNKRRKTMGDSPSASIIPQYQTQTITQLDWSFHLTCDETLDDSLDGPAEEDIEEQPAEAEQERDIFDGPYSSPYHQPVRKSRRTKSANPSKKLPSENEIRQEQYSFDESIPRSKSARKSSPTPPLPMKTAKHAMPPPPTPNRRLPREIPSSQSPVTPISATRIPLREQPINNTPIPFNGGRNLRSSPLKPPKLEIEDTFDTATEISQIRSTPPERFSNPKVVRFSLPGAEVNKQDDGNVHEIEDVQPSPSVKRVASLDHQTEILESSYQREILDSDAEDNDENEGPSLQEVMVNASPNKTLDQAADVDLDLDLTESEPLGGFLIEQPMSLEQESEIEGADATPLTKPLYEGERQEDFGPETCYGDIGLETQIEADELLTPVHSTHDKQMEKHEEHHQSDAYSEHTQMESQRLSIQQVHAMEPRTMESDIFVTVAHTQVSEILDRTRDHLTKAWQIPPRISRIWLYEPKPESALRYMVEIGPTKRPSELTNESGKGNGEFNKKIGSKWTACEVIGLYELADPMTLDRLKAAEWLMRPPSKFNRVPPAVLDSLMANLMPPIFTAMSEDPSPPSSRTDTQEVEAQLISTTMQFTQSRTVMPPSSPLLSSMSSSPPVKRQRQSIIDHFVPESSHSEIAEEDVDLDAVFIGDSPTREPHHEDIRCNKATEQAPTQKPVVESVNEQTDEEEEERIPSSQQATPIGANHIRPSQATTVDLSQTQTQTQRTPRHQHTREIVFESPTRRIYSSTPLRLPTPRGENTQGYQVPESLVPFSMDSSQQLTKSQMLPESLLADSMFVEPPFIMDSDEEIDD